MSICVQEDSGVTNLQTELNYLDSFIDTFDMGQLVLHIFIQPDMQEHSMQYEPSTPHTPIPTLTPIHPSTTYLWILQNLKSVKNS